MTRLIGDPVIESGSNANGVFEKTTLNGEVIKVIQYRFDFTLTGGNLNVPFPIDFPDENFNVDATLIGTASYIVALGAHTISTQTMSVRNAFNNAVTQRNVSYTATWIKGY